MGLLTRVTDNNPFSKDIDELLEKRADVQEKIRKTDLPMKNL